MNFQQFVRTVAATIRYFMLKSGKLHYTIGEDEFVCGENNIIIYRPYEPQFYTYYLKDNSDIYWLHFTGKDVDEWLTHIGLDGRRQFAVKESKIMPSCLML